MAKKTKSSKNSTNGSHAFIAGLIVALVLGLFSTTFTGNLAILGQVLPSLLIILGIIVGYFDIKQANVKEFLTVGTILAILTYVGGASNFAKLAYAGPYLVGIFVSIMIFLIPAVIVVGVKEMIRIVQDK